MARGIIYLMETIVPGLVKIGKTGSGNFRSRMHGLEHDGYRNVTGLKRKFAIEVDDYDEKEILLHTIFAKSRVADTELFAVDCDIVIQLLSSFDGAVVYPSGEEKAEMFIEATESLQGKSVPDGRYFLVRRKSSDGGKRIHAEAQVKDGNWTLLAGSVVGMHEDVGMTEKAKATRKEFRLDESGKLLEDADLGQCTPSHAGTVVMYQNVNGWQEWKDGKGTKLEEYRKAVLS